MSDSYHICYLRCVFLRFKVVSRPMWIDRLSFRMEGLQLNHEILGLPLGASFKAISGWNYCEYRTKVGWLEEDLSIQERKNYRNYALDGCHCLFSFSTLLEFLDTFYFFFSFYLQCWCISCILSVYLNCASSHFVMTLTNKKITPNKNKNKSK